MRKDALRRLGALCRHLDAAPLASLLVHKLVRVLGGGPPREARAMSPDLRELRADALACLHALAYQLGPDYLPLEPTVRHLPRSPCNLQAISP